MALSDLEAARVARMAEARRSLLGPALELQDGIKRYMSVLGEDRGKSGRMSRSSHRELFVMPGKALDDAWKTARIDLRGTVIARLFETTMEERLAPLRELADAPEDEDAWDEFVKRLATFVEELIELLDKGGELEDELAVQGYRKVTRHRAGVTGCSTEPRTTWESRRR